MTDGTDITTANRYRVNGFAHVMERIGLAIVGALCGLFVASLVAKANIEEINSIGALLSAVLYGSVGFYMRIDIPSLPPGAPYHSVSGSPAGPRTNPIALASATGTFLAAIAAFVSVYMIVFDEAPSFIWNLGIGFGWLLGVLLQLAAGTAARLGRFAALSADTCGVTSIWINGIRLGPVAIPTGRLRYWALSFNTASDRRNVADEAKADDEQKQQRQGHGRRDFSADPADHAQIDAKA
jgi:hypothetical protein